MRRFHSGADLLRDPEHNHIPRCKRNLDEPTEHLTFHNGAACFENRKPRLTPDERLHYATSEHNARVAGLVRRNVGPRRPFRDVTQRVLTMIMRGYNDGD